MRTEIRYLLVLLLAIFLGNKTLLIISDLFEWLERGIITINDLLYHKYKRIIILELVFVGLALSGVLKRNFLGWYLNLLFAYSIVGMSILYLWDVYKYGNYQLIAHLIASYIILLILHIKPVREYFNTVKFKYVIAGNIIAFIFGLLGYYLCIVI